jgi:pimeloyl-ACP methyl ester carboxylesterase
MIVKRGFVDVPEGQVHYRYASPPEAIGVPLVMLHPSPGSAKMLEPLIRVFGERRRVVATDTLGNGDSSPPHERSPGLAYFAAAHLQALDSLGIERFDLYGSHTGANIACELAIAHPQRVRRLILDGVSVYAPAERAEMLERYAPEMTIDPQGTQIHRIWNFVRDVYLFWPWYKPDAAHARRVGLPSADDLHDKVVEVLKATRTYHLSYRAAIAYDKEQRLPLVKVPTLLACARSDMFMEYFERVKALMPAASAIVTEGTGSEAALRATVAAFEGFLGLGGE